MKSSSCLFAAMLCSVIAISVTKADCGDPPSIPNATNNGTATSPYQQDTTIRYDCELGYNPVGTSRFYTCSGTTWTDGNFRCEQIYCSHVETPENGRLENTPTYEVGTVIQFACNEGHAMSGQNKMLCRIDGEWLPSTPPTCTARDCGEFGSIQDADLFQDNSYIERNHYGSVVQVTCLDGTTLIGPSQVRCQANGEWGLRPTCEDVQCPPYPNTNSPCISELQTFGVYLFINCKEDVSTHFGPNAAECISGQWDTTEMGCLCDCIIPEFNYSPITFTTLNSHGNLAHATALEWTCHTGRSKI
ncbi:E-selectin-like [Ruditapes philippinarum]|uniref:E-selectin-like n=1 Tax=Ruditapes philippinarum TaxID=129788 RepID=UPI00295B4BBE|nr:E-selectin-like [Ruditapes philippinarum]